MSKKTRNFAISQMADIGWRFYSAFVVMNVWNWVVTKAFDFNELRYWQVCGFYLFIWTITIIFSPVNVKKSNKDDNERLLEQIFITIARMIMISLIMSGAFLLGLWM